MIEARSEAASRSGKEERSRRPRGRVETRSVQGLTSSKIIKKQNIFYKIFLADFAMRSIGKYIFTETGLD